MITLFRKEATTKQNDLENFLLHHSPWRWLYCSGIFIGILLVAVII